MKKIKIMFEYTADCPFWDGETGVNLSWGVVGELCNLPIQLCSDFSRLCTLYDFSDEGDIDVVGLNARLKELAVEFAILNPSIGVHFFDEVEMKNYKLIIHETATEFTEIPRN